MVLLNEFQLEETIWIRICELDKLNKADNELLESKYQRMIGFLEGLWQGRGLETLKYSKLCDLAKQAAKAPYMIYDRLPDDTQIILNWVRDIMRD